MSKSSRRRFIADTSKAAMAGTLILASNNLQQMETKDVFVHHVYFWLKNKDSKDDLNKLIAGLKKLSAVKPIKQFHIGKPADTNRDVIDRSYAVSWLAFFDNGEDQAAYQTDPIHLKFVEECSSLWTKVIVYDSVNV
ncbi:MAG: Dabb family protein [Chitinophagales bacterium]